jgi:hypothetical protein
MSLFGLLGIPAFVYSLKRLDNNDIHADFFDWWSPYLFDSILARGTQEDTGF